MRIRNTQLSPKATQTLNPLVQPLYRSIDAVAIAAISGYQRYLSPYKGFRCAHRVLYCGESCSQYVKRIVRKEGWNTALQKSRVRFAECKEANHILKSRSTSRFAAAANRSVAMSEGEAEVDSEEERDSAPKPRKRRTSGNNNSGGNGNDCSTNPSDCSSCVDVPSSDCHAPHCGDWGNCGDLDCAACGDCSGCGDCGDCGSCSN